MFTGLSKYEATRPDEFWSTTVPAHWQVRPGMAALTENKARNTGLTESQVLSLSYGRVIMKPVEKQRGLVPDSYEGYQILEPGDIVIRPTDLQNDQRSVRVGRVRDRGIITSAYIGLRSKQPWTADYAYLYLMAVDATKRIYGMGSGLRQQLGWSDLKRMPCLVPPVDEQVAIVKYLAHANARIDKAIAAKRRLRTLLGEFLIARLDAFLNLDPMNVEMASVGQTSQLVQTGPFGSQLHAEEYVLGGTPVINPSHITGRGLMPDPSVAVSEQKAEELQRHRLQAGDVIAARRGNVGQCDVASDAEVGWLCGTGSLIIRTRPDKWNPEYFQLLFSSRRTKEALQRGSIGSTMSNLNAARVSRMRLARPELSVQADLVHKAQDLRASSALKDAAIQREIDLLQEFRVRLVADVVTGKVDVRTVATSLPEIDLAIASSTALLDSEDEAGEDILDERGLIDAAE